MTTINGLPAHILLVHAIVVLLPLSAILLVITAAWPGGRRRLAGANAILSVIVLILVPITTDAGEWLERRVEDNALVRDHAELGDTALFVAIPVAVLALLIWWRGREQAGTRGVPIGTEQAEAASSGATLTKTERRTFLAPASQVVTTVLIVLSVIAAGAAIYDVYRIGDSGAKASWQDGFTNDPSNP